MMQVSDDSLFEAWVGGNFVKEGETCGNWLAEDVYKRQLQIICQEKVDSTKAAVLLSLEGVFGSIFSAILLGERYRLPALAGFVLIFLSILLSQTGGRVRNGPGPVW